MKDTLLLKFLYRTTPGRAVLRILVNPGVSKVAGWYLNSRFSRFLVPYYISKYNIDMRNIDVPKQGFRSFNAFFTRKRIVHKKSLRPDCLISPCDGFLSCMPIKRDCIYDIKHTQFTIESLLQDKELAQEYNNGTALIFRLTPANYHRYSYVADGTVKELRRIEGVLHCVRPVATATLPVFAENTREYQVIDTERFGKMVQMEIGALLVGKISNDKKYEQGSIVWAGDEKGYFEFGGSTIVLLFKKGILDISSSYAKNKDVNGEIPVRMGQVVAKLHQDASSQSSL